MTSRKPRIRVLVVDDDALVRDVLARYVSNDPGLELVAVAVDGDTGFQEAQRLRPDVVLMDLRLPDVDGITATRRLQDLDPAIRVIVVTAFADDSSISAALQAGAVGFLLKTAGAPTVVNTIRVVLQGHAVVPARSLARQVSEAPPPPTDIRLTGREQDVLAALSRGLSNRQIAAELHLVEATVKLHLTSLMRKLEVGSRVQALVRAHELGLTQRR